jgi:hypothetical protein
MNKKIRLANQALQLKRAWLILVALAGLGDQLTEKEFIILDYSKWGNNELKRHIKDLEDDFDDIANRTFLDWSRTKLDSSAKWFEKRFESWQKVRFGIFELSRIHELEKNVGVLFHSREIDCPPYAQVLLQGFQLAAIRHPEYHLSRDLALLYNLFLDSESIADDFLKKRVVHSTENSQSLGRSVILTCFNLLESFVSGIAAEYLMNTPGASKDIKRKLEDNYMSLKKRLIQYPDIITGKSNLVDESKPPFIKLLGECKRRRDSFVHCEPGSKPTKWGYIKEDNFHDVDKKVVKETVTLTIKAICHIWKCIHNKKKPSWLPRLDKNGRFDKVEVVLRPADLESNIPPKNIDVERV